MLFASSQHIRERRACLKVDLVEITMFSTPYLSGFLCAAALLIATAGDAAEIIGGKEVRPHSLPYMALLEKKAPLCGGVLIDLMWVLTAAHCTGIERVLLGVHDRTKTNKDPCQKRKVNGQFPHPCYDKSSRVNDLMLLKLDGAVKPTKAVNVLRLPKSDKDPLAGSSCMVAGWGWTSNIVRKMSNVLMSVNVTVVDRVKCNSSKYYNFNPIITKDMICAGSDGKKEADTCQGDSGGPLVCKGDLVGVTSFGPQKCGQIPGVYSFLSAKQLLWIKDVMKKN
ncbi:granzyme A-like [Nerophis ophidion]|uniref:granzyme A-like n=1 Tax=Nerophis ophidion TaxID=159077 RepID=UPI002AE0203C|nr:granzyme A-like [Nerophis ophidion]